jgi:methylated-DNA-protein-cysteine methyltransferase-like protein
MPGSVPSARFGVFTRASFEFHEFVMTELQRAIEAVVKAIPYGRTPSYAGVALRANKPGAARAVVRALHSLKGVPWWRVIRSDGTMAKQVAAQQAPRLRREGVKVTGLRVERAADAARPAPRRKRRATRG